MRLTLNLLAVALLAMPAFAQKYEFGILGGGSIYQSKQITNPGGNASAGFRMGWTAGVTVGHDMYKHIGGEVRYGFLHNQMKLTSGDSKASFGGQAHVIHYDILIHTRDTSSDVRPYVSFGGGLKMFRGTGAEQAFQPLSNIGILTKTQQTVALGSFGAGVKVRLSERTWFRFDVRDYLTPFPKEVIAPSPGSKVSGWINNIVPTAGLLFTF
jgi:hypothetical protein